MPLNDRSPRPVVTHRIACGRPGETKTSPPSSLDFFEITLNARPQNYGLFPVDAGAMSRLESLGYQSVKPRRIPIRVDSDDIDDFLSQNYTSRMSAPVFGRDGGQLMQKDGVTPLTRLQVWCHGDGRVAKRSGKDGQVKEIPCCSNPRTYRARARDDLLSILSRRSKHDPMDGKRCPYAQNDDGKAGPVCKPESIMLVRCDVVANIGARCRVTSHGHRTADALRTSLEDIKAKMPGGILTDVPLDLVLTMNLTRAPNSAASRMQPTMHVELRVPMEQAVALLQANLQARMQISEGAQRVRALLNAAPDELSRELEPSEVIDGADGGGGVR